MNDLLTLALLLRAADPSTVGKLEREAADAVLSAGEVLPAQSTVGCTLSLANHLDRAAMLIAELAPFERILKYGLPPSERPVEVSSFDVALILRLPGLDDSSPLLGAASRLSNQLSGFIEPSRSAAILGTEHVLVAGQGEVEFFYCIGRKPELSHEAFCDFWLRMLTVHSRHTPGKVGYHQLHADVALTRAAARAAGVAIDDFDGVAIEWFPDLNAFLEADAHGRATSGAGAAFMDAERSMNEFSRARSMLGYSVSGRGSRHTSMQASTLE